MQVTEKQWKTLQVWLQNEVGEDNYCSWLQPLRPSEENHSDAEVTFVVPTTFMRDWVVRHYSDILKRGIKEITSEQCDVSYVVQSAIDAKRYLARGDKKGAVHKNTVPEGQSTKSEGMYNPSETGIMSQGNPLDPRFTFDNFVVGRSNEFAFQAARRIAESDEVAYNPFFLYGGVGLGKTHLMQAIAWQIHSRNPKAKILYISSEKFLTHFVRALRDKSIMAFKEAFRSVDVLMVDDIQFIAGKDSTQEEFFHTFDALVNDRKQVILTADKSPHELKNIEERLRSRLGWGLATEMHPPSLETRIAILEKKSQALGIELNRDVSMFLADRISSNVRELEGALNRLVAHSTLIRQSLTVETAQDLLKDLFRTYNRVITLEEIQKKVTEYYNLRTADMHSARRTKTIARPRQIAMYLSKKLTTRSFPEIGKSFGGRDHTTVMHAVKTIEKLLSTDPSVKEDVHLLEKLLSNPQS
jgi:chromosomal replication initiator protein